jgi:hypothetical protein
MGSCSCAELEVTGWEPWSLTCSSCDNRNCKIAGAKTSFPRNFWSLNDKHWVLLLSGIHALTSSWPLIHRAPHSG